MKLTKAEKQAFVILKHIEGLRKEFGKINDKLQIYFGFTQIDYCSEELFEMVVKMLDITLGDSGLASYYLFDRPKKGGLIGNPALGKEWKINTVKDLENYYKETKNE